MNILYHNIESYLQLHKENNIILIPIGCIENHGHLPLGTDTLIAKKFANDILNNIDNIIKTPEINYGCNSLPDSGGGFHICGTICMDNITFTEHLEKIVEEYLSKGHRNFVFLNCHYENGPSIMDVMVRLYKKYKNVVSNNDFSNIKLLHICYWDVLDNGIIEQIVDDNYNPKTEHAGIVETSLIMYLYPKININIDNIKIKKSNTNNYDLFDFKQLKLEENNCKQCILSNPKLSSSEKGELIYNNCLKNIINAINSNFNYT